MSTTEVTLLGEVQKMEIADFIKTGKLKEIQKTNKSLGELSITLLAIAGKLQKQVAQVGTNVFMLEQALNENDIATVEERAGDVQAILEALNVKEFSAPINALAELFGINEVAKKAKDKDAVKKALGFKVAEKK